MYRKKKKKKNYSNNNNKIKKQNKKKTLFTQYRYQALSVVLKLKLTELKKSPSRISESKIPLITKKFPHLKDIATNYSNIKPKIPA